MPELPEVETIVRQLRREIKGKKITGFSSDTPKMIVDPSLATFRKRIQNKKILDIKRKGKIILFELSGNLVLVIHLRLSGQLLIRKPAAPPDRFNHAKFKLGKNLELRFNDLRKFGKIWLLNKQELKNNFDKIQKIGPDPLEPAFTLKKFREILANRTTKIKPLLMDQAKISGIGNIYSDESLFCAQINPLKPAKKISATKVKKLYQCIKKVLREAIRYKGTSVDQYREIHGKKGKYIQRLKVYRRTGESCLRCKTKIKRVKIGGRSAHFCPKCQKI